MRVAAIALVLMLSSAPVGAVGSVGTSYYDPGWTYPAVTTYLISAWVLASYYSGFIGAVGAVR